jgi:DNA-directed RNA polymerase specialized sigma24 family protein
LRERKRTRLVGLRPAVPLIHREHRKYLSKTEVDASDVTEIVYTELYGTRVVDGARVSKFATYSGRGSLRGWLRTVIWHSLVDLHRTSHDEVSLDEMTENIGEGAAHATFVVEAPGGEGEMMQQIERNRYRQATISALDSRSHRSRVMKNFCCFITTSNV